MYAVWSVLKSFPQHTQSDSVVEINNRLGYFWAVKLYTGYWRGEHWNEFEKDFIVQLEPISGENMPERVERRGVEELTRTYGFTNILSN